MRKKLGGTTVLLAGLMIAAMVLATPSGSRGDGKDAAGNAKTTAAAAKAEPAGKTANTAKPRVRVKTSSGDIVLELDRQKAPVSVDNFLVYVQDGTYNGTIFHRVIPNFMIQGGGFEPG